LNPTDPKYYFNRAVSHARKNEYRIAISDLTEAIRLKPDYGKAYYFRADSRRWLGDTEGAISDSNEVWRLDPKLYEKNSAK
jgi:tetratricopeptide (TPR) repeat protein